MKKNMPHNKEKNNVALQEELYEILQETDDESTRQHLQYLYDKNFDSFESVEKEIKEIDDTIAAETRARGLEIIEEMKDKKPEERAVEEAEERAFEGYIRGTVEERAAVYSAKYGHNVYVQLERSLVCSANTAQLCLAVFVVKKLGIQLHRLPHRR